MAAVKFYLTAAQQQTGEVDCLYNNLWVKYDNLINKILTFYVFLTRE